MIDYWIGVRIAYILPSLDLTLVGLHWICSKGCSLSAQDRDRTSFSEWSWCKFSVEMSGSSRRRLSKWDRRDSEPVSENFHDRDLPRKVSENFHDRDPQRKVSENFHDRDPPRKVSENFHDRDPPRKPREAISPSRSSHRHESRSRERMMTCDREENSIRISPGLDEWRHRHHSRSPPRNGRGRSYRSRSRSRSRSQSRSPAYSSRREYALTEKSRGKICRDFAAGRCRRANHCQFLHQDAQPYDTRRTVGSSPPDDWESRDPRSGGSRYSPDNPKDYPVRSERSVNLCNDFLKGRCRRGSSCRFSHHDASSDAFDRGPADDHRSRDTYHDRNHDREPSKRGETLCKFFAAGNCRNGNHCRFSHQVKEDFGPEMWSQDDMRGQDRKFDGSPAWDGPRWGDATRVSNVPTVQGWGEDKSEITEVPKQTWDAPGSIIDEPKTRDERQPLQWNTDNSVENLAGDMEISPRDVLKQTPSLPNISLPAVEQDIAGEAPYEKHCQSGFQEQKTFIDPYSGQNPNFKEDKPNIFLPEGRNSVGNNDFSCIPPNPPMKVQPEQSIFQSNQSGCQEQKPSNDPYNPNFKEDEPNLYPSIDRNAVGNNDFSCLPPNPPMNVQPVQSIFHKNLSGFQEQKGFNDPYSGFKEDKPNLYPPEGRNSVGNNDGSCIPPNPPMNVQQVQSVFQSNPFGFQEQKAFNDPYSGQNPNFKKNNPNIYPPEGRNAAGNNDRSCIPPNPPSNVQPGQSIFQSNQSGFQEQKEFNDPYSGQNPNFKDDKPNLYPPEGRNAVGNNDRSLNVQPGHVNLQPVSSTKPPGGQGQLLFPLHPSAGDTMQLSTTNAHMNVNVQPMSTSINPVAGQGQLPLTLHPCGGNEMQTSHNPSSFLDNTTSGQLSATVTDHSSVSSEQLAQLSHLSASLAQLLESRQQLPQPSSAVTVPPVPETLKQYDPVGDSIELKMPDLGNHTLPSLVEQKTSDNDNVNQQELHLASKDDENGGKIDEGGSKERENRPSEDVAADDGADDGKKPKDVKGIRSFKFALADFIKELLKPTWKDGQVSKEAYKAIVKKVVDKVIETQGAQIPQTKEKIDQYLSCSKPKLEKLVQAYVGKFQKS